MFDVNGFVERLEHLMLSRGTNKSKLSVDLKLSGSAFSDWRTGKAKPTLAVMIKLSEYFSVSLDYLVFGTEPGTAAQDDASASVMQRYNRLPPECQQKVLYYMDGMLAVTEMQGGGAQKAS